jgi:hypothetical protein
MVRHHRAGDCIHTKDSNKFAMDDLSQQSFEREKQAD